MIKVVGIQTDDGVEWHAAGVTTDYDSMCGMDANDPGVGHHGRVEAKRGQKITCAQCFTIWSATMALRLRRDNFLLENGAEND